MTREEAFRDLQRLDPQQAAWLQAMAAHFGKPLAITIRFEHDAFTQGVFSKADPPPPDPPRRRRRGR